MSVGVLLLSVLVSITGLHCEFVTIRQGTLLGRVWTSQRGRHFLGFTGIPYAKPPIGDLRFSPPVPAEPWNGILNATKPHNVCPQAEYFAKTFTPIGNEDCLYLNVYKPIVGKNLPVMFYIYGGSFSIGSGADDWVGPEILLDRDIVLVIFNYRLGSLGFLSTEDETQPGNNGLKDQVLALQWVRENIASFGGNPYDITVFGNSAGGMSVDFFMLSPLTKDLIAKAIIQSGAGFTLLDFQKKGSARNIAMKLGNFFNCSTNSSSVLIQCLREAKVLDLLRYEKEIEALFGDTTVMPFKPIVEIQHPGAFITEHPLSIVKARNYANVPLIVGIVGNEAAYRAAEISTKLGLLEKMDQDFAHVAANSFSITENVTTITDELRQFYFGNKTIGNSTKGEISNLFSDGWYLSATDAALYVFLKYKFPDQRIYVYLFDYHGSTSYSKLYGDSFDYGVCHTDEILYLLPRHHIFPGYVPIESDRQMADTLTKLWHNFAVTGEPTPETKLWTPLGNPNLQYLHIQDQNNMHMKEGLFQQRRTFWRERVYEKMWSIIENF